MAGQQLSSVIQNIVGDVEDAQTITKTLNSNGIHTVENLLWLPSADLATLTVPNFLKSRLRVLLDAAVRIYSNER